MQKHLRYSVLFLTLALWTPLLLTWLKPIEFIPLNGAFPPVSYEKHPNLWNAGYQRNIDKYLEENVYGKSVLTKLRNQIQFKLFGKINAKDIYAFDGIFYRFYSPVFNEEGNFIGKQKVDLIADSLAQLQQQIGANIPILHVFGPEKSHYFTKELPSRFKTKSDSTNLKQFKKVFQQKGFHVLDFDAYFRSKKFDYPIFGKAGIHWTNYASAHAFDSIVAYLNQLKQTSFDRIEIEKGASTPLDPLDQDLGYLCNFIQIPSDPALFAYRLKPKRNTGKKVKALIIADSYFHTCAWTPLKPLLFDEKSNFEYYFNTRYSGVNQGVKTDVHKIAQEMPHYDCIIYLHGVINLENYGFKSISKLIKATAPSQK